MHSLLKDVFYQVIQTLKLNKLKMQQQYDRNLRFVNYAVGQKVWLELKHYKTGKSRKFAPGRDGPWTVFKKLPNGINFKIENLKKERKVVHHDRHLPVVGDGMLTNQRKILQMILNHKLQIQRSLVTVTTLSRN